MCFVWYGFSENLLQSFDFWATELGSSEVLSPKCGWIYG